MKKKGVKILFVVLILGAAMSFGSAPSVQAQGDMYGPGRIGLKIFADRDHIEAGSGGIWNSRDKLHIQLDPADGWRIKGYHVDLGGGDDYLPPLTSTGNPMIGHFAYKDDFTLPYVNEANEDGNPFRRTLALDLTEDLGFQWGSPFADLRSQGVAIFLNMVMLDDAGHIIKEAGAWVVPELVTWIVSEEDAVASDVVVGDDATVANSSTGQLVDTEATEIKQTTKGTVARAEQQSMQKSWEVDETEDAIAFDGGRWGWWFRYEIAHPKVGHFIDSPVAGLHVETPTYEGVTDETAAFDYFPGEKVDISIGSVLLGSALADHKTSPLDVFPTGDTDDARVINMGRLLQSLDADSNPDNGITIGEAISAAFEQAMGLQEYADIDFSNNDEVENIIQNTISAAGQQEPPILLTAVAGEDAKAHLDEQLDNVMFRKNVSKTPDMGSTKAKMNISTVWFPAFRANDELATYRYRTPIGADEECEEGENRTSDEEGSYYCEGDGTGLQYFDEEGNFIRSNEKAKPIVITYTDADPVTHAMDTWAAISRDDGETWKRKNLSRSGDLSSFTLANGETAYGYCKKPVFQIKGNMIMVAWSSKYASGGKPGYAIDPEDDYTFDDAYYTEDIWGVGGPQLSHDYSEEGFPEVGEVPHSALWTCRGIIATQANVDKGIGKFVGDIVWFKPERVTSGRRDVNQIFLAAASGAGFAMVWQEDPNGVQPGRAVGPGPGWGGATTSHKTDIWYSYLTWGDFAKIDMNFVPGSEVEHLADVDTDDEWVSNRPKALVPCSLPVRLSDNEMVNTDNILVELDGAGMPVQDADGNYTYLPNPDAESDDADGTHRYATEIDGLISDWHEYINYNGEEQSAAVTADGRLLDGDTGASRGNIFLQPYIKADGTTSAWTIITYEETKGAGAGPPEDDGTSIEAYDGFPESDDDDTSGTDYSDAYIPESGKNVIYHSFDFQTPDLVAAGGIVNRPEFNDINKDNIADPTELVYLVDENGAQILDYLGRPQLAYENARRGRFMPQGWGAVRSSRTPLLMVHKQGPEGAGRPSDILLRRWEIPENDITFKIKDGKIVGVLSVEGNPYRFENIVGEWVEDPLSEQYYFADGVQNMSSVTSTVETESLGDPEAVDAYGAFKVVEWEQTVDNLQDPTWLNPYDDARAHRGAIRGDFVAMGFSYTANWAAARNGHDHFDFYIRRSFNGGKTWITDPKGSGVNHCRTWIEPSGTSGVAGSKTEVCTDYAAGQFEAMHNLSQLPNHKASVIEPRIVAVPGTIKSNLGPDGKPLNPEDRQNASVFYVAYGTSSNPIKDPITGEQDEPTPADLYWSFSQDKGESYHMDVWQVNGEPTTEEISSGDEVYGWGAMAKGDQEQGEVQLRETPDGSRFYASWLDEGEEGSDIVFRRIMSADFPVNVASTDESATAAVMEDDDEGSTLVDDTDDSGGDD